MKWTLPAQVYEHGMLRFLNEASQFHHADVDLTLNFQNVKYWMPAPVIYVCALVNRWVEQGRTVYFENHTSCEAFNYLQRIDFFEKVGLNLPENFRRHPSQGNFMEIEMIQPGQVRLRDPTAVKLADCLAGAAEDSSDVRNLAEFALGEVITNVQQHADSEGFCSAQYVASRDWARIGVVDAGRGVRASFEENNAPGFHSSMNHADTLELALRPWVSSRRHLVAGQYGETSNRGVGLNMIHHMISETYGIMILASGNVMVTYDGNKGPRWENLAGEIPGTLVSIRFSRNQIPDYTSLLQSAQQAMHLTKDPADDMFFQ